MWLRGLHSAAACVQPGIALHAHSSSALALQADGCHADVPLAAIAAQLRRGGQHTLPKA